VKYCQTYPPTVTVNTVSNLILVDCQDTLYGERQKIIIKKLNDEKTEFEQLKKDHEKIMGCIARQENKQD
jgi:hypothetical protein